MSEAQDTQSFEEWSFLKSRSASNTIATRASLRVAPLWVKEIAISSVNHKNAIFLILFRSVCVSLLHSCAPSDEIEINSQNLCDLSFRAASAINNNQEEFPKPALLNASTAAAHCINSIFSVEYGKNYSKFAVSGASIAVSSELESKLGVYDVSASAPILEDIEKFEKIQNVYDLVTDPLWIDANEPEWSKKWFGKLKEELEEFPDQHWHVWIDWWEDRRDGKPYNIEMEREIVLIPDEDWQQGPAHVNAMIAEIRARYAAKDIPADNPVAPRFETVENRVVLRAEAPDALPDDEQAGLYDALREQAVELCGLCPENSNRYGAQGKAVARFLAALGEDYGSMRLSALWLAGQKMRRFARADEAKRVAADPEDDPMEPDQSALFAEVVMTYNVFSTDEPGLKAKDEKGRDPATLSPDVTEEARAVRGAVAGSPALFDEDVIYVLDQVLEEAEDPIEGVEARGKVMVRETTENLIGQLVRKERDEPKPSVTLNAAKITLGGGVVTGVGYGAYSTAGAFIAANEALCIAFVSKLPLATTWIAIIKRIALEWAPFI